MSSSSTPASLPTLTIEIFDLILTHITAPRDLASLCLVSQALYSRVIPKLYYKFSFHGIKHSKESLRGFFMAVLWNAELAGCVRVLDLGEWDDCPKLEDWVGMPWIREEEEEEARRKKAEEDVEMVDSQPGDDGQPKDVGTDDTSTRPAYFRILADDSDDSEFEPSDSEPESDYDMDAESDIETDSGGYIGCGGKDSGIDVYDTLRAEARDLGFAYEDFLGEYYSLAWEPKEKVKDEVLMCRIVPLLKNVHTLYLMPIEDVWADTKYPFLDMVKESKEEGKEVFGKLETVYICSSLHLGTKDHREYEIELSYILPFTQLPSLRTLKTLTAYTTDDMLNNQPLDYSPYTNTSPITSLILDESSLPPYDSCKLLGVPKSLTYLRWTQNLGCYSVGTCVAPFRSEIGIALQQHKHSLTHLDLDLQQRDCQQAGHPGNPNATLEQLQRTFAAEDALNLWKEHGPKERVLIGDMSDFEKLTVLEIDVTAFCGHQSWARPTKAMVELLPRNLHTLHLRVKVKPVHPTGNGKANWDNENWVDSVLDLLDQKEKYVPGLTTLKLSVFPVPTSGLRHEDGGSWNWEGLGQVDGWGEGKKGFGMGGGNVGWGLGVVRKKCESARVDFAVAESEPEVKTKEEWFAEQSSVRNPGRDW